jgi:outer membrane protein assembly factor BamB
MNTTNVRIPMTRQAAIDSPRLLALAVTIALFLSIVAFGQVSQAQSVFPPTEWTYPPNVPPNVGGNFFGGLPAVHNGRIYVAGQLDGQFHNYYYLFAFFYFDGTVIWKKQLTFRDETTGHPVWVSAPAVGPNGVIYITADGKLWAFNTDSSEKWWYEVAPEARLRMPAVAFDGTVYICTYNQLLALTPDGKYKWAFTDPNNVPPYYMSSPTIGPDGTVYVTRGDTLYAVNPNGSKKWQYSKDAWLGMPVIGHNGTVYVSGEFKNPSDPPLGRIYALSPNGPDPSNNPKWTQVLIGSPNSPVIGPSGDLYLGTTSGYFYAIKSDGDVRWVVHLDKAVMSMAAVADFDRVMFSVEGTGQADAELYVLAGGTGEILARYKTLMVSTAPIIDIWGATATATSISAPTASSGRSWT